MSSNQTRYVVCLAPGVEPLVSRVASLTGLSPAAVLERGVRLLEHLCDEQIAGRLVQTVEADGSRPRAI